jgi:O-antigen ligase
LSASDAIAFAGIGAPVLLLVLRGGGGDVEDYCAASALALVAGAFAVLLAGIRSQAYRVPWFVVAILSLPFLQLIPVGSFPDILVSNEIRELRLAVARLGVEPPSTISLYPLATLRAGIVIAGCCAIFVLAAGVVKRLPAKWPFALTPLAAAGIWEAILGLRQFVHSRWGQTGILASAHGTFVNRDHFAVLLEACLGVAVGLALFGLSRARRTGWLAPGGALCFAGTGLAALSLTGVVLSSSRAGIAIGALLIAAGLFAAVLDGNRGKFARRAPLALALAAAAVIALYAVLPDDTVQRFETLWKSRGDPLRLAIWADSWRTAHSYPWAGSGLGAFGSAFRRSWLYVPEGLVDHAHSDYLEILVELGFPAAILLAVLIAAGTWASFRNMFRMPRSSERWLRAGCLLGAAAILLHATYPKPCPFVE